MSRKLRKGVLIASTLTLTILSPRDVEGQSVSPGLLQIGSYLHYAALSAHGWRGHLGDGPGVTGFVGYRLARSVVARGVVEVSSHTVDLLNPRPPGSPEHRRFAMWGLIGEIHYQAPQRVGAIGGFAAARVGRAEYLTGDAFLLGTRVAARFRFVKVGTLEGGVIGDLARLSRSDTWATRGVIFAGLAFDLLP